MPENSNIPQFQSIEHAFLFYTERQLATLERDSMNPNISKAQVARHHDVAMGMVEECRRRCIALPDPYTKHLSLSRLRKLLSPEGADLSTFPTMGSHAAKNKLPPDAIACLLDCLRVGEMTGNIGADTAWVCDGRQTDHRTSTVQFLLEVGLLQHPPLVARGSRKSMREGRPNKYGVIMTEAGISWVHKHVPDFTSLQDTQSNREACGLPPIDNGPSM
jgi:hypothetical protein